ncbi:phage tail tape measure protein [Weissella paramesenteroides]|uniref:phage tail tape measure protein n=1 Tax=Weissella paramesenteroides TaxID=1249 RepID=UPI00123B7B2C|nr:phage tail tape measure protein [Weissella paramesenteroides]KAA8457487.1 CHAP domain-containing protein [Weissella paramesenteroides]KAA8458950.1 CHAP domain-containing protein [Weissella paramesenteroides]KAA8460625.1 CHAP domain-containing protein [Weissella paramesenteroides]KAA8460831.1 CHAP domain-containing protein [Weissella paramesenteroides]KAA8462584.1 CHAP domain-containing protein [Weissella paramesenteroides]
MAKQIVSEMATNLSLDTKSATAALKELTSVVKNSSAEARILENQYKSSGEEISASKAKYEGLQHTLDAQKDKIDALKAGLENVNTSTAKGRDLQIYLNNELAKAERQYASYNGQIEKAKRAYELQESGITSLNKEIQQNIKETNTQIERLEAEGKTTEANKAKKDGLSRTLEKQSQLYEAQTKELDRMTKSGEASSDSISQQKVALDRTATAIAKGKSSLAELDGEQSKFGKNKGAEEAGTKMEGFKGKIGKSKEALVAMGATATAVLGTVAKAVSEAANAQSEVNALQAKTTLSYKESKQGIAAINKLYAQGYGESIEELQETYSKLAQLNPNASVKELANNTKLVSTYAKQSGADVDEVMQGADKATRNWHISYQEYFDNMSQLQKMGDDQAGDISDNMAEYSQVLGQMGLSISDSMALIDNGVKSGAYNGDKLLDFTKEFQISLNDGRMDDAITSFSKKSQEMFKGYKDGKVSAGDMFKQITGEMGTMTDKQKEATIASNLWSALGEDNSLKVIESLGKTNDKFDDVKGTADKTSKQLKESNPFELMRRSAESSIKSISLNTSETKEFKKNLKPLQKSLTDLIKSIVDNLPVITKTLTPLLEFTSKHLNIIVGALATMAGLWGTKKILDFGSALSGVAKKGEGLIFKPKVDGSDAKRELGVIGKLGKGIGKGFVWSAKLGKKAFTKSLSALKTTTVASGKGIVKGLKFTASIATKGAKLAMASLVKTAKVTGSGIKLAFNFLKANPLILLITGITAAVVALTTLYQHNKKFRNFVNGLVKSAQNFFKGIAKWFGQVYKKTLSIFKSILKFMQKDWKEILLFIVNPISGAFALIYKHNKKFRKAINNLVKTVINYFKNMGKNISRIFNNIKDLIGDTLATIGKNWRKGWRSISSFFSGIWNGMKKFGHDAIWSVKNTFDDVLGKISKAFSNTWKGIKSGFSDMWEGMKQLAGDGINAVIKIPNAGISGINGLIHDFGGPKHAIGKIPKVKFANGTGVIDKLTHAVLNDGNDSPATGNKEMLIHPNGASEVVQGRNTERLLLPGTEVLNARETAMLMGLQGITHFANGTGFWKNLVSGVGGTISGIAGKAWDGLKNGVAKFTKMFEYITGAVKDPAGTLTKVMGLKNNGISNFADGIASGAFKKIKGTAKDWWSTLWNMANDASSTGADGGMKGDDYKYKSRVADSMPPDEWGYYIKECVSFVANRLSNMGVSANLFSHLGNGSDWVNAPVRHTNNPKPGMVAVYGPGSEFGNHVAMVTGVQGNKISGEEYNWNYDHKYHQYHGRNASGATTFLDFGKSINAKAKEIATNSPLAKLIKKQTGGMLGWIQKFIAPLNDSSTGEDGNVQSWADDVKKALHKLGLSDSASMVQKVLRQINTESGGNPKAIGGTDGYNEGHATGLMQVKPPTFNANALPGHKNIFNGYDNILAGLNYARKRYGDNLSYLGNGHGYANGGLITRHQFAEIGENNQPEMIIPLDAMKSSRGFELLGKTAVAMAARDGQNNTTVTTDNSKLESKLDNMISLLSQLVAGQGNQVVQAIINKDELYRQQATDMNMRDVQSLI